MNLLQRVCAPALAGAALACTPEATDAAVAPADARADVRGEAGASDARPGNDAADTSTPADSGTEASTPLDSGGTSGNADAGSPKDAGPDAEQPPPPPGTVPMLVASGLGYRTTVSYDEGQSWVLDQPIDAQGLDCAAVDCTHHPGNSLGLAYGNGWFFVEFGNVSAGGKAPQIMRSRDAVRWESVYPASAGGLAYGNLRLVGGRNPSIYSDDDGATWREGKPAPTREGADHIRKVFFVPYDGGRFLFVLSGPETIDILVSRDGIEFEQARTLPEDCAIGTLAYAAGVIVGSGGHGRVCRSNDGGSTWTAIDLNGEDIRSVVRTDSEFIAYHWDRGYKSADGVAWREFQPQPGGSHIGPTARTATGAFATFRAGNTPGFMRSTNGESWQPADAFARGYHIQHIVFGYGTDAR